ncbi:LOW QUALITY PROTEIN: paralemmin-3 [Xyrichtys novacula]|nr:LOW QUALITY PROTEIN: paralemmin-3 [Xyrichtys novacula]
MDETEKYKQRLEAIAEKRRLQEEQDKARREMEDEKLRLQQLKRKSLRDQWLMEGAPLSPSSPDTQSPRSPLWGSQAQKMEEHVDKLESECQRLAEEEEKLKEQMEDGQTEAERVAEAGAEIAQDAVLQNGENKTSGIDAAEDEGKIDESPDPDEAAAVLTNGQGESEEPTNHSPSAESNQHTSNGPVVASEDEISQRLEPELSPGEVPNVSFEEEEEEEEGTLVMRAERVIITDEGDDVPQDLTPQEDQQETVDSEETPLKLKTEAGEEGGEAVDEVGEVGVKEEEGEAPETSTQPEQSEATAEAQPHAEEEATDGDVSTNQTDSKAEGQESQSEEQLQSHVDALEGATVAPVPVYSEVQLTAPTTNIEAGGGAEESTEPAEAALEDQDPAPEPGEFQEVPLADPKEENPRTEAGLGEQEPLLSQAKAPDTQVEPAAAAAAATAASTTSSSETPISVRAGQGEETQAPKRKTCQCCSVM